MINLIPRPGVQPSLCHTLFPVQAQERAWVVGSKSGKIWRDKMNAETQRILRAMSPAQKLMAAERLYYSARQLKAAALRAQHPEWNDATIRRVVREAFLYARG